MTKAAERATATKHWEASALAASGSTPKGQLKPRGPRTGAGGDGELASMEAAVLLDEESISAVRLMQMQWQSECCLGAAETRRDSARGYFLIEGLARCELSDLCRSLFFGAGDRHA
mmetsp:Transcript_137132/g.238355  ORF Transcript_137132/g.238355 Transcript_137132/m.238355 type:complete len:116 (-) Transcript_137132:22-369(-)